MSRSPLLIGLLALTFIVTACGRRTIYVSDGQVVPQQLALRALAAGHGAAAASGDEAAVAGESTPAPTSTEQPVSSAGDGPSDAPPRKAALGSASPGAVASTPASVRKKEGGSTATRRFSPPVAVNAGLLPYRVKDGQTEYLVGVGDLLGVRLFNRNKQEEIDLLVPPSGKVSISFLEDVEVVGRTPSEIDKKMTQGLAKFLRGPRIDVFVKKYDSKRVFLFGEVNRIQGSPSGPGIYPLKGRTTLLELLLQAGSEGPEADLTQVELLREGKVYALNLEEALYERKFEHNPILQANDRIVIPNKRRFITEEKKEIRVGAFGEVNNAGSYRFPTDRKYRILDLIAAARGFKQSANLRAIRHIRSTGGKVTVREVNYWDILKGDLKQNMALKDGDQIYLERSLTAKFSTVLARVNPILSLILIPATLRDVYTTGGGLRFDTGFAKTGDAANVTSEELLRRALPIAP